MRKREIRKKVEEFLKELENVPDDIYIVRARKTLRRTLALLELSESGFGIDKS